MFKKSLARIAIKVTRRFWPPSLLQSWDKLSNWSNLWNSHRFAGLQIGWLSATQQCDWLLSAVDSFAYWKKLNGEAFPGRCKPLAACEVFFSCFSCEAKAARVHALRSCLCRAPVDLLGTTQSRSSLACESLSEVFECLSHWRQAVLTWLRKWS